MRTTLCLVGLLVPVLAVADFNMPAPGHVEVRDVPGTSGNWQEARTVVDAPPERVRGWFADFEIWPHRFRDIEETRVLSRQGDHTRVWVRSHIMKELVLDVRVGPQQIVYSAVQDHVDAESRIYLVATGDGRTDVVMQSRARLTGLLGAMVPRGMIRDRSRQKLVSDLSDLNRLARARGPRPDVSSLPPTTVAQ